MMKHSLILVALLQWSQYYSPVIGFTPTVFTTGSGLKLPSFQFPWDKKDDNGNNAIFSSDQDPFALKEGDTIAVIGASGNVGKLVSLRLSDTYKVNGVVRDSSSAEKLKSFYDGRLEENRIQFYESDLLEELERMDDEDNSTFGESLIPALKNANAIVICTGTTAFPTDAWSRSGEFSVTNTVLKSLLDNKFSIAKSISDLDALGLNTPNNVDNRANGLVLDVWNKVCTVPKKRIIMLSSIGVERRDAMPFPILNTCGVLDAKAAGEKAVKEASTNGCSYTIIRPGQLFGGPYDNNYYLGTLFQLDKDAATQDVQVGKGDELLGDTLRSTLAEVTAQVCEGDFARDMDFAVVNVKGDAPDVEMVKERLDNL